MLLGTSSLRACPLILSKWDLCDLVLELMNAS